MDDEALRWHAKNDPPSGYRDMCRELLALRQLERNVRKAIAQGVDYGATVNVGPDLQAIEDARR